MGQKTNPSIFRLSKTCDWKSKYIEKKSTEFYAYTNKDIEIRKFLDKFFKDNGLIIHDCKINHSDELLNLYVTYLQNLDSLTLINDINKTQNLKVIKRQGGNRKKKYFNILKNIKNYHEYGNLHYKKKIGRSNQQLLITKKNCLIKRVKLLSAYKKYLQLEKHNKVNEIKTNNFINKLCTSISLFLGKNTKITLLLRPLNKTTQIDLNKKQHSLLKKKLVALRKYQRNEFFKEGINLAFSCVNNGNSANLISNFISTNLRKLKRHNFFLKFVTNLLTVFILKTFSSKIAGIKIKVKGRFNGAPRAKHKIINIGKNMPVLKLSSKINYAETTAYTLNGTFGVKVWVAEI